MVYADTSSGGGKVMTPYYVPMNGSGAYQAVPVVAGDYLMIWGETTKSSSCSTDVTYEASLIVKQSTYAASTTVDTTGNRSSSGGARCSGSTMWYQAATTTETWTIQQQPINGGTAALMIQAYH